MAQVLRALPKPSDANLLAGAEHFEDAGIYRLDDQTAIVVTVDFFPPLVDDPYIYGQIAAANSLSSASASPGVTVSTRVSTLFASSSSHP